MLFVFRHLAVSDTCISGHVTQFHMSLIDVCFF